MSTKGPQFIIICLLKVRFTFISILRKRIFSFTLYCRAQGELCMLQPGVKNIVLFHLHILAKLLKIFLLKSSQIYQEKQFNGCALLPVMMNRCALHHPLMISPEKVSMFMKWLTSSLAQRWFKHLCLSFFINIHFSLHDPCKGYQKILAKILSFFFFLKWEFSNDLRNIPNRTAEVSLFDVRASPNKPLILSSSSSSITTLSKKH